MRKACTINQRGYIVSNALTLIPLGDIERMAAALAKSGLFGMKSNEQALALMLVAQAEGQHPATIAQDYDIIQGRAARKTHSVLARFQAAGGKIEWHALTDTTADATFSHQAGGSLRMAWTLDQAKKAGLTGKDNWKNYPRAMLRARCIAEGVRAVYPAALGGMLVAEEAQDMPAEPSPPARPAIKNMGNVEQVVVPPPIAEPSETLITAAQDASLHGVAAYAAWFGSITKDERKQLDAAGHHKACKQAAAEADAETAAAHAVAQADEVAQ